jgi:hypothetical protein
VIIEEVVSNVRAIERENVLSPEVMRQLVDACVRAVHERRAHEERVREERSVEGPWGLTNERGG